MKAVIQRVLKSSVTVDGQVIGQIGHGYNVLLGVCNEDTKEDADKLIRKLIGLRICEDENGKTNLSIKDTDGELLIISQFTLYADCRKGRRPSFTGAGSPEHAKKLYELRDEFNAVAKGAGQQNISADVVKKKVIIIPNKECIDRYTSIVAPMFDVIRTLQEQNVQLQEARDRLLPKLMNGEIEV